MKKIPKFKTDQEAEDFLDQDLSEYIGTKKELIEVYSTFELKPKNKMVSVRMSEELISGIKREAQRLGIDYQKFIRMTMEQKIKKTA